MINTGAARTVVTLLSSTVGYTPPQELLTFMSVSVYDGHKTQGETVLSDMSKIAKSASRKELFILLGEITTI